MNAQRDSFRGRPSDWLDHARGDLQFARLGRDADDIRPELIGFHAQQAVEKAIKAVLLDRQVEFPLVHDIGVLLEIAESHRISLPVSSSDALFLNPFAVQLRYPGEGEEIALEEIDRALAIAESFLEWADRMIAGR